MLGDPELEPARDYLNELRRTAPVWRQRFLADATSSGKEIFRAQLFEAEGVWEDCERYWGGGPGFRDRVRNRLAEWFNSQNALVEVLEQQVQASWRESFLAPLATLCGSLDLLSVDSSVSGRN
jgi:hypothetical protein